jgi:O-antigen/teichoic acid export membrane protein
VEILNIKKINKDLVVLVIGKVLQVIISLLAIRLLTTYLMPEELGNYYLLLTLLTFLNFTLLSPVSQYYGRHVILWKSSGNLSSATAVLFCCIVFGGVLTMLISNVLYHLFDYNTYYSVSTFSLFVFISFLAGSVKVLLDSNNILGYRIYFVKYTLCILILGLLSSVFFIKFFSATGIAWLYGIAFSQILFFLPVCKKNFAEDKVNYYKLKEKINYTEFRKVIVYIFPLTIALLLQWGQNSSYRIIVETKYTVDALAYIAVGLAIASSIFYAIEGIITPYFMPDYLKRIIAVSKLERAEEWNRLANSVLPIYLFLVFYVVFSSPFLLKILVSDKYSDVYIYVAIGALIEFFRVTSNVINLVSLSELKTKSTILPYFIGVFSLVVALYFSDVGDSLWIIPSYLAFSYLLITITLFINMKKLLAIKLPIIGWAKASSLSLPFICFLVFDSGKNILFSCFLVFLFGLYFLFVSYFVFFKRGFTSK